MSRRQRCVCPHTYETSRLSASATSRPAVCARDSTKRRSWSKRHDRLRLPYTGDEPALPSVRKPTLPFNRPKPHQKLYVYRTPSTLGLIGVCATMKLSVLVNTTAFELLRFSP